MTVTCDRLASDIVELIQRAGFDTVRIPVRWSAHVAPRPPFTIEPSFLGLVDMAIATALEADLDVVINVHHDRALNADPTRRTALGSSRCGHRSPPGMPTIPDGSTSSC